jgi:hypothetical protein
MVPYHEEARMRVLWVDTDENPWSEANGWKILEDSGVDLRRISSVAEALSLLSQKEFDLVLVRAELDGAAQLLVAARRAIGSGAEKLILTSSEWSKEQFRVHAKTEGAAHRYARVPMPPSGFLAMVADLFKVPAGELGSFSLSSGDSVPVFTMQAEPPTPKKAKRKASATAESEDVDVLRKYLRIKEEQLEISEGEREELSRENERVRKEATQLQSKLREFEHLHDELTKKVLAMEEERVTSETKRMQDKEDLERVAKSQGERAKLMEVQVTEAGEKYENLRVRVRKDIRKIRENERDLEARLELMRKDSSTLLQARDEKVFELQRKIDALEFDLDQIQDSRVQAQMEAERYLAKLSRVARALHIATGMIEEDNPSEHELEELEPVYGGAAEAEEEAPSMAAGAETPPPDAGTDGLSAADNEVLDALAHDGEPTQMISREALEKAGGEPESSSG